MKTIGIAGVAFFASIAVFGQTPATTPEFEVASIKPSAPPNELQVNVGLHLDGAQLSCNYLSVKDLIRIAYRVKDYQVSGPDWIAGDRFDIAAKLPAGASREDVPAMLQALLAERFQLKLHRDQKEFPVYALTFGKGPLKLTESAPDPETTDGSAAADPAKAPVNVAATGGRGGVNINYGHGSYFSFADNKFEAKKLPMARAAESLARFLDRPVVDMTGLKGNYDFVLQFSPEDYQAMLIRSAVGAGVVLPPQAIRLMDSASGDSLFTAIEAVGLKLERRKAPLDVLVIDHIEKTPTAN